jgi:hypothetical protein
MRRNRPISAPSTTTAPIVAISHTGTAGLDDGHWPYAQFDAAATVPVFGVKAAAMTTASIARPSAIGIVRRLGLDTMRMTLSGPEADVLMRAAVCKADEPRAAIYITASP